MIRVLQMIGALEMGGSQALVMNLYRHMDRERIQFDFVLDHPDRDDYAAEVKALGGRRKTICPRGRLQQSIPRATDPAI